MINKIKCSLIALSLVGFFPSLSMSAQSNDLISMNGAVLQVLDKPSGKTKIFNLGLNKPYKIDRLTINVRSCFQTPEYMPNENMAFLQIDKAQGGIEAKSINIFSGWMYKSMPGQNPLTDETYDIWLLKCN